MGLFGDRDFLKKLISIALPLGLQSMITMMVNLIDTIMIGSLGDIALSGVNISSQFPFLAMTAAMGVANAGLIITSQAWGNKRPDKVKSMIAFCLRVALVVSLVFFVVALCWPGFVVSIYSNNAEIIVYGAKYLKILAWSLPFQCISIVIVTMVRSAGINKLGLYTSMIACFTNMIMNYLLIFGHLGFPQLGLQGAAIATVLARVVEFVIAAFVLLTNKKLPFKLMDVFLHIDKGQLEDFVRIGTPTIISEMTMTLNASVAAMITGRVSPYYIAANSIVHNIWTISNMFMFGVGTGSSVIIGHTIGANEREKAEEYAKVFIRIGMTLGMISVIMTQVLAPVITSYFNVSAETLIMVGKLKNAASIAVFFQAMQTVVCKGVLRGAGQAALVTKVDLITCWLLNLPIGFFVALVLHADPFFIYLSLRVDYLVKTIWGMLRIKKGNWIIRLNVD